MPARYSRLELKAAAARFHAPMKADPGASLFAVHIPIDGSRLIAVYDKDAPAVATAGRARSALKTSHRSTARSIPVSSSGIPIEVVMEERVRATGRLNDGQNTGIYSGGARIWNNDNGIDCTSGFGVTNGTYEWMLTAGHCSRVGTWWFNGNYSQTIGKATWENQAHDLILIYTNVDHLIWDGGATTNMFVKAVTGWDWAKSNELVCQSGATSGTVCDIKTTSVLSDYYCTYDAYGVYECYYDLVVAKRASGTAARGGDSGAPVFILDPANHNHVKAKGIVSGGGGTYLYFQDMATAVEDFGIWMVTS